VDQRGADERQAGQELALWRAMFISMTRLLNRVEGDVKAAHDLTLLDLGILLALSHSEDAAPMGSLAATFGVDPSVITYRLKRLEARGLAIRTRGSDDRRYTFARSTPMGRAGMLDALGSMLASARARLLSRLEPAEVPVLAKVFMRLQQMQQAGDVSVGDAPLAGDEVSK
jgi:DNA-binding MarR family transcriptional regulator